MENEAVRLPPNHRIVLDIVREQGRGQHATTGDIFSEAKRRKPRIGYSTVYRALDRLRALGLVSEVRIPGTASALYEPAGTGHVHFVCDGCGRVDDINHAPAPSAFEQLAGGATSPGYRSPSMACAPIARAAGKALLPAKLSLDPGLRPLFPHAGLGQAAQALSTDPFRCVVAKPLSPSRYFC